MTAQEIEDVHLIVRALAERGRSTPEEAAAAYRLGLAAGRSIPAASPPILSREELAAVLRRATARPPDFTGLAIARRKAMETTWWALETAIDADELELAALLHSAFALVEAPAEVLAPAVETLWGFAVRGRAALKLAKEPPPDASNGERPGGG